MWEICTTHQMTNKLVLERLIEDTIVWKEVNTVLSPGFGLTTIYTVGR